jgi:cation-transporting ATPase E
MIGASEPSGATRQAIDERCALISLTRAATAVTMSRQGVLAQQLNAIESLASVDTICVDKTGTLTAKEPARRRASIGAWLGHGLCHHGAGDTRRERVARNLTLQAIADAYPADAEPVLGDVPFSSRRRWSASQVAAGSFYLGAPGRVPVGELEAVASSASAKAAG